MSRACGARQRLRCALAAVAGCGGDAAGEPRPRSRPTTMILATTTSTRDSGLLDVLVPDFERRLRAAASRRSASGPERRSSSGERGDADVLLVHSPEAEEAFMARRPRRHAASR